MPANDNAGGTLNAFLGCGILRPFRRDLKNDVASAGGLELIKACVGQVLGTMAASEIMHGELPWNPRFGSLLYLGKHRKGALLTQLVKVWATDALKRWEPRVEIADVTAVFDPARRLLTAKLTYNVIDVNVPGNNVLFEDVAQDVVLPVAA